MEFKVDEFRQNFPILAKPIEGHRLTYLDSAASSLKPRVVAEALYNYYLYETANIHRGAHYLSRKGTERYEAARTKVQKFIDAASSDEIIFTRGTTESINLLMYSYGLNHCKKDDVILLSPLEHHSNIVPWQLLVEKNQCQIQLIPVDSNGAVDGDALESLFKKHSVKIVSVMMYSNVTGTRLDVEKIVTIAHKYQAVVMVDAAQAMLHEDISVTKLACDFLTFSGHKMLAPYGIGVLYGKKSLLDQMPPFHGGGSMISRVGWDSVVYQNTPHKFEAGTPSIADAIGLGVAIDFISAYSMTDWQDHERDLFKKFETFLKQKNKVKLISVPSERNRSGILSFSYEGAHASDVAEILDQMGVAVRAGHHCAQPLMDELGLTGTVRISLAPYNNEEDFEYFCKAFNKVEELL